MALASTSGKDNWSTTRTGDTCPWPPLGLLKVRVVKGTELAVRDFWKNSSDPYVVIRIGKNKVKTHVKKKNLNPEWNEELTLAVTDPAQPMKVEVYDRDTFTKDDPMGTAVISMESLLEVVKMKLEDLPDGTVIKKIMPSRQNCFAEESHIHWSNGMILQDVVLRLRNVESGELEMQLKWVSIPNAKGEDRTGHCNGCPCVHTVR